MKKQEFYFSQRSVQTFVNSMYVALLAKTTSNAAKNIFIIIFAAKQDGLFVGKQDGRFVGKQDGRFAAKQDGRFVGNAFWQTVPKNKALYSVVNRKTMCEFRFSQCLSY